LSWTRKLLPISLRVRLILSFGLLIFLSLFLAGIATVYLLRAEQERTARERVGLLAEPVALRAAQLEASGLTNAAQIQSVLETEYNVRILLVDGDATVRGDTGETLRGVTLRELAMQGVPARPLDQRWMMQRYRGHGDNLLLFTTPRGVIAALPGLPVAFVPRYQAVIAVSESDISQAWRDLLPRLVLAGGVALAAGVVAATLLARSITRPLQRITAASSAMAEGRYDQQIPAYGGREVGKLAEAFNAMARQVSRSHRTLREFLANVSHELKTPLTSIQGFSQAMTDGSITRPEDFREAARVINEEAVRMRGLVDDLLYLSQVEAGEVVMHHERLDPLALMEATRDRFLRRAAQAGVEIDILPSAAPELQADPRRLEQAVANIVDNAVRHTPAGGKITLSAAFHNGHLQIAVHNTGSFIPQEARGRVFDRFFQLKPRGSSGDGNTGLGLAITREIVEAHGGGITVASSEEGGTEFVISLPNGDQRDRRPQGAQT
jgi:signal transduction histidine kinase